jgi:putative membrane protein
MKIQELGNRQVFAGVMTLSLVVLGLVILLNSLPQREGIPSFVAWLPRLNALLNATCTVLLVWSWRMIKARRIETHKKLNITAFVLSSLFLLSYVLFHSFGIETRFPDTNPLRPLYLVILISHIVLAAIVLPMVLLSFYYALSGQIATHRRLTSWSMPIWLYVTTTGVLVYLMISPYYNF